MSVTTARPCTDKAGAPEGICRVADGVHGAVLTWGAEETPVRMVLF